MRKRFLGLSAISLLAVAVVIAPNAGAVSAKFDWHVSDAFIQAAFPPQTGAMAEAENGDIARVSGAGTFNSASGSATGGGVFAHTDAEGDLVGFGTWTATGVEDFDLFGCGVAADGTVLPADFCGGVLTLEVHLSGVSLTDGIVEVDGVLTIVCKVGDDPGDVPADAEEGVTLDIPGLIDFDDTLEDPAGLTVFVSRSRS